VNIYKEMGIGPAIQAINIKISDMQRELALLRSDVKKMIFLLDKQSVQIEEANQHRNENTDS